MALHTDMMEWESQLVKARVRSLRVTPLPVCARLLRLTLQVLGESLDGQIK